MLFLDILFWILFAKIIGCRSWLSTEGLAAGERH